MQVLLLNSNQNNFYVTFSSQHYKILWQESVKISYVKIQWTLHFTTLKYSNTENVFRITI